MQAWQNDVRHTVPETVTHCCCHLTNENDTNVRDTRTAFFSQTSLSTNWDRKHARYIASFVHFITVPFLLLGRRFVEPRPRRTVEGGRRVSAHADQITQEVLFPPHPTRTVLSSLFQAMGHFKKFPVAEGRIGRLLQSNPDRCPGTAVSSLGLRSIGPDHNALLQL